MKSPILLIIALIFIVTGTQICSQIKEKNPDLISQEDHGVFLKKIFSKSEGDSMPYRVMWPVNYSPKEDYPLVLFLHGAGERGKDNELQLKLGSHLFLDSINQEKFPCIAIFPQCPEDGYWSSTKVDRSALPFTWEYDYSRPMTPALKSAIELLREIVHIAPVDEQRIYIMGLSMGGMGTFEAVYHYPELWAAAIAICGGGDHQRYTKQAAQVPFWVFHGTDDVVVPVQFSRAMVDRLKTLDANVTYTEYPEVNHNSWDYAFEEPTLLSWLFNQRKQ